MDFPIFRGDERWQNLRSFSASTFWEESSLPGGQNNCGIWNRSGGHLGSHLIFLSSLLQQPKTHSFIAKSLIWFCLVWLCFVSFRWLKLSAFTNNCFPPKYRFCGTTPVENTKENCAFRHQRNWLYRLILLCSSE